MNNSDGIAETGNRIFPSIKYSVRNAKPRVKKQRVYPQEPVDIQSLNTASIQKIPMGKESIKDHIS